MKPILTKSDVLNFRLTFVNTELAREPANHFYKYGKYTNAAIGTKDYEEYWAIQRDFCENGYWLGNTWLPGKYYFYLNFCQIKASPDALYYKYFPKASSIRKVKRFPSIWEMDYLFYLADELCQQNRENTIPEVNKVIGKTRRAGFSYKEASKGAYNFTFKHGSLTRYLASSDDYLTNSDGIFSKVIDNLTFINKHTAWGQLRQKGDRTNEKIAQFFDKSGSISYGHKSKLSAMVIKSPEKVRGGDADEIIIEEGGSFAGLLSMLGVLMPQIKEGVRYTGTFTLFGTGNNNEQDKHIEGLETIFYNPAMYDCLSLPNIWEEAENEEGIDALEECGLFIPYYFTLEDYRDNNGNLDLDKAKEYTKTERSRRKGAVLSAYKIEHPIKPSEMFNRNFSSSIPKELKEQARQREKELLVNKLAKKDWQVGRFMKREKDEDYIFVEGGEGYHTYPVPIGTITKKEESSIEIYQSPYLDWNTGRVPDDMYGIVIDPVAKDVAPSSESLCAAFVYRKDRSRLKDKREYKLIVAAVVGRWNPRNELHEQVFLLAKKYNARIQFEIQGGGSDIITDAKLFQNKLKLNIFELFETQLNTEKLGQNHTVVFGTNITDVNKSLYVKAFVEMLQVPIGYSDYKNRELTVLDTIDNIGLLREIYKHREDKNVDRMSACYLIRPQLIQDEIRKQDSLEAAGDSFFTKPLFQ